MRQHKIRIRYQMLLMLLLTSLAYTAGLSGGFAFDDYSNILLNTAITDGDMSIESLAQVAWSGTAGPLKRPISMLSFALNYHATGSFPLAFKLTNLVIHLINGLLVFWLAILILRARAERVGATLKQRAMTCALVVSAVWLVHPFNLTSVLFIVQRMNSLAATFSLFAIICFCIGRNRIILGELHGNALVYIAFPGLVAIGALCKENALLSLPLIALIEICFFRFRSNKPRDRTFLLAFFGASLIIPTIIVCSYLILEPDRLVAGYVRRPFSLSERLLTESRVIWFYVSMLLFPRLSQMGLFHDDLVVSTGFFEPSVTIIAIIGIVIIITAAIASIRRFPLFAFAILWFAIAHSLESTLVPLELVHEHRNYLPSVGLLLGIFIGVLELIDKVPNARQLLTLVTVGIISVYAAMTFIRAGDWSDPITLATVEAERNPQSLRNIYELGRVHYGLYLMRGDEQDYRKSLVLLERASELDPNTKRPLVELMRVTYIHGEGPKPEWKMELVRRYSETLLHHSEWVDLSKLVKCHAGRDCEFPRDTIVELLAAALSNPTASQHDRARIMAALAAFYVNEQRDYSPALALLDDALKIRPLDFGFNEMRAEILIMAGRTVEAERAIEYIDSQNSWDDFIFTPADRLTALKRKLSEAKPPIRD